MKFLKTVSALFASVLFMAFTNKAVIYNTDLPINAMDTVVNIPNDYTSVVSSVVINTTKEEAWQTMFTNFSEVSNYFYSALHSECPNNVKGEVGAQRVCYFNKSKSKFTKEEVIAYAENEYMYVKVLEAKPKLEAIAKCELVQLDSNKVQVKQTLYYKTKPKFVGKIFKGSIRNEFEAVLIGMKYFIETSETVNKENFKAIKKQYKKMQREDKFSAIGNIE